MNKATMRIREEDLGLLETAAEQIEKAGKDEFFPQCYEEAAGVLRQMKDSLAGKRVDVQEYNDFFRGKTFFYRVLETQEEFYVTRKKTLFLRRNFKVHLSLFRTSRVSRLTLDI